MAQCLDSSQCSQYIMGILPPNEYNMNGLRLPVVEAPSLHFPWYSTEICILALLIHLFLFLFSAFDFVCSDNQGNSMRRLLLALVTIWKCLWKCFCPSPPDIDISPPPQPSVSIQLQPLIGNNDRYLSHNNDRSFVRLS